jgi:DNA topoisomerase-1
VGTIQDRGYVEREGKAFKPTELGMVTNDLLVKHFPTVMDIKFTAHMEENLDEIVAGKMKWVAVLEEFYSPFEKALKKAEVEMKKVKKETMTDEICEKCGKPMVIRAGRYGDFLACSGFPKCKNTRNLPSDESEIMKEPEVCEKCGKPMTIKRSRYGTFLACSGYPKCKNIISILKPTGAKCPLDGGDIVERKSKRGKIFYGCGNYPKCKFATWYKPVPEPCPKCGSLVEERKVRGKGLMKKCTKCDFMEPIKREEHA